MSRDRSALFKQTDLIAIFGRRGTGKTTMCRTIQRAYPRVIIIDLLKEYGASDADYIVETYDDFDSLLGHLSREKTASFRVVYQFDIESNVDDAELFDRILRLVYYFGDVMLVIEEIHHYMKREHTPEWLKKMILVGRHRGVGILATSQRPAEVSKTFVSQCHHVFCGKLFERNDLKYFADTIGEAAEILPRVKPFHFLHYRPGVGAAIVKNS